jgi:hypothetical protein
MAPCRSDTTAHLRSWRRIVRFCRDSLRFVEIAVAIDFVMSAGIMFALAP